jgi:hypothetical protein
VPTIDHRLAHCVIKRARTASRQRPENDRSILAPRWRESIGAGVAHFKQSVAPAAEVVPELGMRLLAVGSHENVVGHAASGSGRLYTGCVFLVAKPIVLQAGEPRRAARLLEVDRDGPDTNAGSCGAFAKMDA